MLIPALCPLPLVAVRFAAAPVMLVKAKLAGVVAPGVVAVTEYAPAVALAVNAVDVAMPLEFVVSVSVSVVLLPKSPLAPEAGAVKVTATPLVGDPLVVTVAESGRAKAVLSAALCPPPLVGVMVTVGGGGVAVFVKAKLAGVVAPDVVAVTEYAPAVALAVKILEVAMPLASVVSVSVAPGVVVAKVPLAPDAGAVKVTGTPLAGAPLVVTVATSGLVKAALT